MTKDQRERALEALSVLLDNAKNQHRSTMKMKQLFDESMDNHAVTIRAALEPSAVERVLERTNNMRFTRDGYGRCMIEAKTMLRNLTGRGPDPESAARKVLEDVER